MAGPLEDLREHRVLAADLNHDRLAAWIVTPDGNPAGPPVTIPLRLAGSPASQRDGRLRAAISALLRTAREHGCAAIAVEDLSFADAREQGRERHGSRPSRGKRGRGYRRMLAGIPTGKFRDRLAQMAANAGLAVMAVDPASQRLRPAWPLTCGGQLIAPGADQAGQRDQGRGGALAPSVQVALRGHPAGLPALPQTQVAERDRGVDQEGHRAGDEPQGQVRRPPRRSQITARSDARHQPAAGSGRSIFLAVICETSYSAGHASLGRQRPGA